MASGTMSVSLMKPSLISSFSRASAGWAPKAAAVTMVVLIRRRDQPSKRDDMRFSKKNVHVRGDRAWTPLSVRGALRDALMCADRLWCAVLTKQGSCQAPKRQRCRCLRRKGGWACALRRRLAPSVGVRRAMVHGRAIHCDAARRRGRGRARVSTWRRGVLGRRCRAGPSCGGDQGWRSGHCSGPNAIRTCGGGRARAPAGPVSSRQAAARVRGLPADDGVPPPQKA